MSESKTALATSAQIQQWKPKIPRWKIENSTLTREFAFKNFYQTMAFVNAVAWLAHQADHHPDLAVSYDKCVVSYSTHSAGGLSEMDFLCSEKVDSLS
jgi:4a-hydroxytetrahydrobiopterin dehydratase